MLKMVSFHIQAHLNTFLQILEYSSQSVDVDGFNLLAYSVFELFVCVGYTFVYFVLSRPQGKKSAGVKSGDVGGQRFFEIILSLKTLNFSRAGI
jgi:hypothetical protein